jgi:endogenous inhibitor of DNA gyrase (YacG/DUF329 family)
MEMLPIKCPACQLNLDTIKENNFIYPSCINPKCDLDINLVISNNEIIEYRISNENFIINSIKSSNFTLIEVDKIIQLDFFQPINPTFTIKEIESIVKKLISLNQFQ